MSDPFLCPVCNISQDYIVQHCTVCWKLMCLKCFAKHRAQHYHATLDGNGNVVSKHSSVLRTKAKPAQKPATQLRFNFDK